jgi:hypothetical protein
MFLALSLAGQNQGLNRNQNQNQNQNQWQSIDPIPCIRNTGSCIYSISLDRLPESIQNPMYSVFLEKYTIQILESTGNSGKSDCQKNIRVKFPDGWTWTIGKSSSHADEINFFDETNIKRLSVREKLVGYDCCPQVYFYSDQEIEETLRYNQIRVE